MKVNQTICLDVEIVDKLENINKSELINKLLQEHFDGITTKNMTILEQKQANYRAIRTKIKGIRLEIRVRKALSDMKIDQKAIRWCKGHDERPSSMESISYIRQRGLNITCEKLFKAWELIKKHGVIFEKE